MTKSLLWRALRRIKHFVFRNRRCLSPIEYWHWRARKYGRRSVFDLGHSEDELESITELQKTIAFPLLKKLLNGSEQRILDFGCGTGRFTRDLAEIIQGRAVGIDPIARLFQMAPATPNVKYLSMHEGQIPLADLTIDVVWICLVLGGIVDDRILERSVREVNRVLKPDGLLFLIENTAEEEDADYWKFRSVDTYQSLFKLVQLQQLTSYIDMGQPISIMAGRKTCSN